MSSQKGGPASSIKRSLSQKPLRLRLCYLILLLFVVHEIVFEVLYLEFESGNDDKRYEEVLLNMSRAAAAAIEASNRSRAEGDVPAVEERTIGNNATMTNHSRDARSSERAHQQEKVSVADPPNITSAEAGTETSPVVQDINNMTNNGTLSPRSHEINKMINQTLSPRHHDKQPILQILADAGVKEIDDETIDKLPTWSNVTFLYGHSPRIHGLDQCEAFRKNTNVTERIIGIAGTFNTGTNLLFNLLDRNCRIPERMQKHGRGKNGMKWQVPWGKHNPPEFEEFRQVHKENRMEKYITNNFLPVVAIRDPYSWMGAMCRSPYSTKWQHTAEHCPNLVPNDIDKEAFPDKSFNGSVPVWVQFPKPLRAYKGIDRHHESLAHLWNYFYGIYSKAEYPRIMVRLEDLLFHTKQVIESLCTCVGGEMTSPFEYVTGAVKGGGGHASGTVSASLIDAITKYGSIKGRLEGYDAADVEFARKHLDRDLVKIFGYPDPPANFTPVVKEKNKMINRTLPRRHDDKKQILQILADAGVEEIDDETIEKLPSWSNVTFLYGDSPRIYGLDQCEAFRNSTNVTERIIGVAGTFNTGTNLLNKLLSQNCHVPQSKWGAGTGFDVPWGKHNPPEFEEFRQEHKRVGMQRHNVNNTFPVATIRDPYSWMQAMCRAPYSAKWKYKPEHCPNLVPNAVDKQAFPDEKFNESVPVWIQFPPHLRAYKGLDKQYDSLAHLWNDYYGIYLKAKYPRVIVRLEDLLFYTKQVTESLCNCVGGEMKNQFQYVTGAVKGGGGHANHEVSASLIDALVKYGSIEGRLEGYDVADVEFARKHLDRDLVKIFGYPDPPANFAPAIKEKNKMINRTLPQSHHDKKQILQILEDAGVEEIDDETIEKLPSWSNVTFLYGDSPRIYGLDQCEAFRNSTNATERILAVAGTFNTGTNLMLQLLERNCRIPERVEKYGPRVTGMEWQVPWGKHNPPKNEEFRQTYKTKNMQKHETRSTLPVVTTRDPYTWMKSMCRAPYAATWLHNPEHCPNLIPNEVDRAKFPKVAFHETGVPVAIRYTNEYVQNHDSLAHMWSHFYGLYFNAEYPRIMVRMEDLVFHAKEVVESLCSCVGGVMFQTKFNYVLGPAKTGGSHIERSLIDVMLKYVTPETRFEGYETEDLRFASKNLNPELTELFGYSDPPAYLLK